MKDQYEEFLSQINAEEYWQRVIESGWLEYISDTNHGELEKSVKSAFDENPIYAHTALTTHFIDGEFFSDQPYTDMLTETSKNSFGRFQPRKINEKLLEDGRWEVSFEHEGKAYHFVSQDESDYYDADILTIINTALKDSEKTIRLLTMPPSDQCLHFVFETPEIFRKAEQLRVIPPPMYFLCKEGLTSQNLTDYLSTYYQSLSK